MTTDSDAPYWANVAETARRLGIPVEQVEKVMDTYEQVSKEAALRRRDKWRGSPTYQK